MPINKQNIITFDDLYDIIYYNLPIFLRNNNYQHIFDPNYNNTTKKYLNIGYNINEAYSMSITTTLILYSNIKLK